MAFRAPLAPPPVAASVIERMFLNPGMDARALNLEQYDPSPGVDSLLERIRALALRLPPSREREVLIAEVDRTIASNGHEGDAELQITGGADQLVRDLRRIEQSRSPAALSVKAIARELREPLRILAECRGPAAELAEAHRQVREAVAQTPTAMLLSSTVEYDLGQRKFAVLREYAIKDGAARSEAAGAAEERWSAPHAGS